MNIEKKLGFDKIKNKLKNYALSNLGIFRIERLKPETNFNAIKENVLATNEYKKIEKNNDFSLENVYDLRKSLESIRLENTFIEIDGIIKLWKSLITLQKIKNYFASEENPEKYPVLYKKSKNITIYKFIFDLIKKIITKEGKIKDNASKELKKIRAEINEKELKISGIVKKALKNAKKQGILESEIKISVRDGKLLIPVDVSKKKKIEGVIQDYSSTGKTVFVEPLKSVELNNQLKNLYFQEKREIIKILLKFSENIRPYIDDILQNFEFLADIDFIRAKAKLAIELKCVLPKLKKESLLSLRYAKHPLLLSAYAGTEKKVVPLHLDITEEQGIVMISGPNAGGKSIAIKTVGLLQYMVQCGLLPPVKNTSEFGIFKSFFVDIGDDQSIDNDLSTYSSHLLNMKKILAQSDKNTLLIIDEFGSGTDPAMGGPIAEAILEELLHKNVKAVINTHYSNLKHFATNKKGILNAAMLFDRENLKPLYIMESGSPGSSFAFEIAQNIGLDEKIIKKAKEKAGEKVVNFDKIISTMESQSRKIRKERQELKQLKQDLYQKVINYRKEKSKIVKNRKKIISEAEQKAKEILRDANKSIENTIKTIKTTNAEKNAVKKRRKKFQKEKEKIIEKVDNEKKEIKKQEKKLHKKAKKQKKNVSKEKIKAGDNIIVKKTGLRGKVEEIKDGTAMIIAGNLRTFVKINMLEKTQEQNRSQKIKVNIKMNKTDEKSIVFGLDVRGKRANEAVEKVAKYIDNAIVSEAKKISILHGTGDGILRNYIRQYLNTVDEIEWFDDADIREGGSGITIVKLKE